MATRSLVHGHLTFQRTLLPPSSGQKQKQLFPLRHWYVSTKLHSVKFKNTVNMILNTVRTSCTAHIYKCNAHNCILSCIKNILTLAPERTALLQIFSTFVRKSILYQNNTYLNINMGLHTDFLNLDNWHSIPGRAVFLYVTHRV